MQVVNIDGPRRVAYHSTSQRFHWEVMGVNNSGRVTSSSHPHRFHHMYSFAYVKELYGIMEGVVVLEAVPATSVVMVLHHYLKRSHNKLEWLTELSRVGSFPSQVGGWDLLTGRWLPRLLKVALVCSFLRWLFYVRLPCAWSLYMFFYVALHANLSVKNRGNLFYSLAYHFSYNWIRVCWCHVIYMLHPFVLYLGRHCIPLAWIWLCGPPGFLGSFFGPFY